MHSNRRAARRALLFLLMLGALGAPKAEAQYFTSKPADAWRTATGQSAPAPSTTSPRSSISRTDALSKENLENMSQASAVRVGCGVSTLDSLANLSVGFTEIVGFAWGAVILGIGLFTLRGRKGGLSRIVRGGAIAGFAAATPALTYAVSSFLNTSMGLDTSLSFALGLIGIAASMLGMVVLTSPDKFGTIKRIGKSFLAIAAVIALCFAWAWTNSAIENARYSSAKTQTAPVYTAPTRTSGAAAMPVGTLH